MKVKALKDFTRQNGNQVLKGAEIDVPAGSELDDLVKSGNVSKPDAPPKPAPSTPTQDKKK